MRRNDRRVGVRDGCRSGRSSGQAIVEFVVIAPVMMLMLLMAVDFGRLFYSYVSVHNAAREATFTAARQAAESAADPDVYAARVAAAAVRETEAQPGMGAGAVSVSVPACFDPVTRVAVDCHEASRFAGGSGKRVSVTVSRPFDFMTPLVGRLFGDGLTISATATGPVLNPLDVSIVAADPSPSPFASPSAAPAPAGDDDDDATPAPTCTVPDFYHTYWNDISSLSVWHGAAGFTGALTDQTDGRKIKSQSLAAGTVVPCSSAMSVSAK